MTRKKGKQNIGDVRVNPEMDSTSTQPISPEDALKSIPIFKENLRTALEALQSHSSSLPPSIKLDWSDFDSHYSSLQTSLQTRFKQLQTSNEERNLKSFCIKMDKIGLRNLIIHSRTDHLLFAPKLTEALKFAPDPAKLVLDALTGFYPEKLRRDNRLCVVGRTWLLLLRAVSQVVPVPEIKPELREEANKLSWWIKGKVSTVVFLQFLVTFWLKDEFRVDALVDMLVSVSSTEDAVDLCKGLRLDSKVPELIEKLNGKRKQTDAIKFAYAFELVDMFPPVSLLEAYLKESKKVIQEILDTGNNSLQSQNVAFGQELHCLHLMMGYIEKYKLESQYPPTSLEKQIEDIHSALIMADPRRLVGESSGTGALPAHGLTPEQITQEAHLMSIQQQQLPVVALPPPVQPVQGDPFAIQVEEFRHLGGLTFKGESGPMKAVRWLKKTNTIFSRMHLTEIQMQEIAAHQMEGAALVWWESVEAMEDVTVLTWADFQERFERQYISTSVKAQLVENFLRLRQKNRETVSKFVERFQELSLFASHMVDTDAKRNDCFIRGLRPELARAVTPFQDDTFQKVKDIAIRLEQHDEEARKRGPTISNAKIVRYHGFQQGGHRGRYHPYGGRGCHQGRQLHYQHRGQDQHGQQRGSRPRDHRGGRGNPRYRHQELGGQAQLPAPIQQSLHLSAPVQHQLALVSAQGAQRLALTCFKCQQVGHIVRNCPTRGQQRGGPTPDRVYAALPGPETVEVEDVVQVQPQQ